MAAVEKSYVLFLPPLLCLRWSCLVLARLPDRVDEVDSAPGAEPGGEGARRESPMIICRAAPITERTFRGTSERLREGAIF
jgi:hypothetical protein